MIDIEESAAAAIVDQAGRLERYRRPAFLKALMRLAGNALAIATNHDEASQVHISLGRQHSERVHKGVR